MMKLLHIFFLMTHLRGEKVNRRGRSESHIMSKSLLIISFAIKESFNVAMTLRGFLF